MFQDEIFSVHNYNCISPRFLDHCQVYEENTEKSIAIDVRKKKRLQIYRY